MTILATSSWAQTTPFFPFDDDFEDNDFLDDAPVSIVPGGFPLTITPDLSGNMILTEPFQLEGFSLGLTFVTKGGQLVDSEDASLQAVVRVSDDFAFAGLYTRGQFGPDEGGDGGAYFCNISGNGVIQVGSFTGTVLALETPLDPVNEDIVLQFDTVGAHVTATAWAADNPATKYSQTFIDTVARPVGFMGQSFGRGGPDATGAFAIYRSLKVQHSNVVIDGLDSGVPNYLLDDGSLISCLISDAAAGATNHGEFVSGVAALTNALVAEGILTGWEKGAIQRSAAHANLP